MSRKVESARSKGPARPHEGHQANPLRVAVFAEGSIGVPLARREDPFVALWRQELPSALGLRTVDAVYGINKKHLLAMDPANPPMSGCGEPLDLFLERKLRQQPLDAAVVAWDLFPEWADLTSPACRWLETVQFYKLLADSKKLPDPWVQYARDRAAELGQRPSPGDRPQLPRLHRHGIYAVCMDPDFEGFFVQQEDAIRRALGVEGKHIQGWPRWRRPGIRKPWEELLVPAITSVRQAGCPLPIRGDLRETKNAWGLYLIHSLTADPEARDALLAHRISLRLRELLAAPSS